MIKSETNLQVFLVVNYINQNFNSFAKPISNIIYGKFTYTIKFALQYHMNK